LHELGEDRDGHLLVRGVPEVQPGRDAHLVELVLGQSPVGEVAQDRRAALAGPDEAEIGGPGGHRMADQVLVAVALGGDDDHRLSADAFGRELAASDQVDGPADRLG
jgi:hypothetical protein